MTKMRNYRRMILAGLALGLPLGLGVLPATAQGAAPPATQAAEMLPAFKRPLPVSIINAFRRQCEGDQGLSAAQKAQVAQVIETDGMDAARQQDVLMSLLATLHPTFKQARELLGEEETVKAVAVLKTLLKADDPFLAANARFLLARAYAMDEIYEEALPLLEQIAGKDLDKTLHSGDALFMLGVAQARTLHRKEAIAALNTFNNFYPEAPERMRIGAQTLVSELLYKDSKPLADVGDRMSYSERRLTQQYTAKPLQEEHDRIIAILDKLIKEAEEKEKSGSGSGSGSGGGQSKGGGNSGSGGTPSGSSPSGGPAANSQIGNAGAGTENLHQSQKDRERWGSDDTRRERGAVIEAAKGQIPDAYKDLIEQYYKSITEGGRR